ncbi:hypothetical protein AB0B79_29225 [Streptomyces sp. NPDC039022]|uniref:hypothetical protein n=1 Tax=Streptomyces sp. NPDC039022 TaxID=3157091 RepID=UPI003404B4FE
MDKAFAGDEKPLLTAHPEHYVMGTDEIGARVVETIGPHVASLYMDGWGTDALDWAKDAAELLPESGFLRKMSSNLFQADGTVVGRALIQFGDTADGFTANLTVYVPVSYPDEVLDHHLRRYAVEFMRAWAGTRPNSPRSPTTSPPTAWPWRCSPAPCPMYDPRGPGRLLLAFFAALAENQRENIRESPLEGFDAAARKGKHGGRPPVITEDMLHTVLRRRANGESVERIQPGLIIPTGKRKGQALSVASICRALAKRGQQEAYPEAVAQAHADFADLQDAYGIPGSLAESASGGRTIRSPRRRPERDQSQRHFLYRNYSHPARPVSSVELKLVQRELGGRSVCVDWGYP